MQIDVVVNVTGTSLIMSYPETITFEPSDTEKTITFVLNAGQVEKIKTAKHHCQLTSSFRCPPLRLHSL